VKKTSPTLFSPVILFLLVMLGAPISLRATISKEDMAFQDVRFAAETEAAS
jgi:hypothetical protein